MRIRSPQDASGTNLTVPADLAAYVEDSLYDANTILAATVDNTPAAVTVAASTLVGRGAAGGIDDLSPAAARTVLEIDSVASGKGSALVGSEDVGGFFAGVNVEAQLQDLGNRWALQKTVTGTITAGNTSVDIALGAATWNGKPAVVSLKTATDATLLYVRGYSYPDPSTLRVTGGPANATDSVDVVAQIDGR